MTPGEFREFAKAMQEFGLSRVKIGDVVMVMAPFKPASAPVQTEIPRGTSAETSASDPIKHKVEQLASLMKLSDFELVDQLFPEPTEAEESA